MKRISTADLTTGTGPAAPATTCPQIWIRLPTKGRCPHTGFTRPFFYQHLHAFKSACIREKGNLTGVRLVWLPSVMTFIEKHVDDKGAA